MHARAHGRRAVRASQNKSVQGVLREPVLVSAGEIRVFLEVKREYVGIEVLPLSPSVFRSLSLGAFSPPSHPPFVGRLPSTFCLFPPPVTAGELPFFTLPSIFLAHHPLPLVQPSSLYGLSSLFCLLPYFFPRLREPRDSKEGLVNA